MSSPLLCGYRKGFTTQTPLLYFIEKWNFIINKKEYVDAILMDLSKAFDTVNYKHLVAKLGAYRFIKETSKLILS